MSETELERLVVRLVGDNKSYLQMLQQSQQHTKQAAGVVEQASARVEHFSRSIEGFGTAMERAFAVVGIGVGIHEAMEKYEQFEKNTIRFRAVLEANGRDVQGTTAEYKKFAKQLADTTTATVGETFALLKQAETYGVTGKAAERAAKEALAVSKILDTDAETLLRFSQALAKGDLETAMHFKRMIGPLREVRDEEQLAEKWGKLVTAGTKAMSEEMETSGAKIEKAKQKLGMLTLEIGGFLANAVSPMVDKLSQATEWFTNLDPATKKATAGFLAVAAGVVAVNAAMPLLIGYMRAFATNPLGLGLTAVYLSGRAIANLTGSTRDYANQLEKTTKLAAQFSAEVKPDKYSIENAKYHLRQLEDLKHKEEERIKNTSFWHLKVGESFGKTLEPYEDKIKELGNAIQSAELERLTGKIEAQKKQASELAKEIEDTVKNLKLEAEYAGHAADELERAKLAAKGATFDQLKSIEAAQHLKNVATSLKDLEKELERVGLSDRTKKIFDFIDLGLSDADIDKAMELFDEITDKKKALELKEKFKTPAEKLNAEINELNRLLKSGEISWELYSKAVEEARKRLMGAAASMRDAAAAGSAEAFSRLAEYWDKIKPSMINRPGADGGQAVFNIPGENSGGTGMLPSGRYPGTSGEKNVPSLIDKTNEVLANILTVLSGGQRMVPNNPGN